MISYFQAIQTALFYKKNMFKMVKLNLNMFLDLWGSCGQDKIKAKKKLTNEMWSQIFARVVRCGLGICQRFKQINMFWYIQNKYIFKTSDSQNWPL